MRAQIEHTGRDFQIKLSLHPEDTTEGIGQQAMRVGLVTDSTLIRLPAAIESPHPDLLALAALLVARPWSRKRLIVGNAVSAHFAGAVGPALSLEISPVDPHLVPRAVGSRPGLMYSGGPDCMAAELLLDERLPLLHLRRIKHPRVPNRWPRRRPDVVEQLVRRAADRGEELHVARSDLEFLCAPFPSYPQWATLTVGAVLQADDLSLAGLVTGRNISGMFLKWGHRFDPAGDEEERWKAVFSAVGLPLIQPAAGMSDIATKSLARHHRLSDLARSCIVGTQSGPCLRCRKCIVTELISATVAGEPLSEELNRRFASDPTAIAFLANGPPYHNHHLLEYALARLPGVDKTIFAEAASRLPADPSVSAWVNRYYRPALDMHVPRPYRATVAGQIEKYMRFMDKDDERQVETWTASAR